MQLNKEELASILIKTALGNPFILNMDIDKYELVNMANTIGGNNSREQLFFTDRDTKSFTHVRHDGLFGSIPMGWHYGGTTYEHPTEITEMLYCVDPGDYGVTSFCNTKLAFDHLDNTMKNVCSSIFVKISTDVMLGRKNPLHGNALGIPISPESEEFKFFNKSRSLWKPLVTKHPWNDTYSLNNFVPGMIEDWTFKETTSENLWNFLNDLIFSPMYVYDHAWKKGDLIIYDQYSSLHKRSRTEGDRVMYRFAVDNKNVFDYVDY